MSELEPRTHCAPKMCAVHTVPSSQPQIIRQTRKAFRLENQLPSNPPKLSLPKAQVFHLRPRWFFRPSLQPCRGKRVWNQLRLPVRGRQPGKLNRCICARECGDVIWVRVCTHTHWVRHSNYTLVPDFSYKPPP